MRRLMHRRDELRRHVDLEHGARAAREREIRVTVRVVPDLVPFVVHALEQALVRVDVLADDEERRLHAARAQRVEDHRRPASVRPVVEGERDAMLVALLSAGARDDVRNGHLDERRRGDVAGARIDGDVPIARRRGSTGSAGSRPFPRTPRRSRVECVRRLSGLSSDPSAPMALHSDGSSPPRCQIAWPATPSAWPTFISLYAVVASRYQRT